MDRNVGEEFDENNSGPLPVLDELNLAQVKEEEEALRIEAEEERQAQLDLERREAQFEEFAKQVGLEQLKKDHEILKEERKQDKKEAERLALYLLSGMAVIVILFTAVVICLCC